MRLRTEILKQRKQRQQKGRAYFSLLPLFPPFQKFGAQLHRHGDDSLNLDRNNLKRRKLRQQREVGPASPFASVCSVSKIRCASAWSRDEFPIVDGNNLKQTQQIKAGTS